MGGGERLPRGATIDLRLLPEDVPAGLLVSRKAQMMDDDTSTVAPSEGTENFTMTYASTNYADFKEVKMDNRTYNGPPLYAPPPLSNAMYKDASLLPHLQYPDGDTLLYLSYSGQKDKPSIAQRMRVYSHCLLSTNSAIFKQLLEPKSQKRIIKRLEMQRKLDLSAGQLPSGIKYVLDLTPEEEGEQMVEWMEKLWCHDDVLNWRSALSYGEGKEQEHQDYAPNDFLAIIEREEAKRNVGVTPTHAQIRTLLTTGESADSPEAESSVKKEEEGECSSSNESTQSQPAQAVVNVKNDRPAGYSYNRHVLSIHRLLYLLHQQEPVVTSTVDIYTLHCLSVRFGTTDATRDFIACWIYSNYPQIVEQEPALVWRMAVNQGLVDIAADAWSSAVVSLNSYTESRIQEIPGVHEGRMAFRHRVCRTTEDLFERKSCGAAITPLDKHLDAANLDRESGSWIEQFLPPTDYTEVTEEALAYYTFVTSLTTYIYNRLWKGTNYCAQQAAKVDIRGFRRSLWQSVQQLVLYDDDDPQAFILSLENKAGAGEYPVHKLQALIKDWKTWETHVGKSAVPQNVDVNDWADIMDKKMKGEVLVVDEVMQETAEVLHEPPQDGNMNVLNTHLETSSDWDQVSVAPSTVTSSLRRAFEDIELQSVTEEQTNEPRKSSHKRHKSNDSGDVSGDRNGDYNHLVVDDKASVADDNVTIADDTTTTGDVLPPAMNALPRLFPANVLPIPYTELLAQVDPKNEIPFWLSDALIKLRDNNPDDRFWGEYLEDKPQDYQNLRIRCSDCTTKVYFIGPGQTINNFKKHLKYEPHVQMVKSRLASEYAALSSSSSSYGSNARATTPTEDYNDWIAKPLNGRFRTAYGSITNIPPELAHILSSCQNYIASIAASMLEMNVNFDVIVLEDEISCLDESERRFMPLWAGGEEAPSESVRRLSVGGGDGYVNHNHGGGGGHATTAESSSASAYGNVSTVGVGSTTSAASSSVESGVFIRDGDLESRDGGSSGTGYVHSFDGISSHGGSLVDEFDDDGEMADKGKGKGKGKERAVDVDVSQELSEEDKGGDGGSIEFDDDDVDMFDNEDDLEDDAAFGF